MNSESHRKVLIKVLNEAYVDKNISVDKLEGIVGHILVNNYLAFSDEEIPAEGRGHNQALNISIKYLDRLLTKVLIDNDSSLNVLPKSTLDKLPYDKNKIQSSSTIVRAFDESHREVVGEIEILVQIGPFEFQIHFQSLEIANTTLAIGTKKENKLSPLRVGAKMMIKKGYRVGKGLGRNLEGITRPVQVRGNLGKLGLGYQLHGKIPRKTLTSSQKRVAHLWEYFVNNGFANQVKEEADESEGKGLEDYIHSWSYKTGAANWTVFDVPEGIEIINLGPAKEKKEVKVGAVMRPKDRRNLVQLLMEYVDIFAWSYRDMPGLDNEIVEHKIPLEPHYPLIKQKLRIMSPDVSLKIKEEMRKQLEAGFLTVAKYPQCVANIVPIPKKDGKVRMCVDYRDLNKASPKDDFPLLHIDVLVDNTT
ncbi:hypothetical protein CR513_11558, partial [Mucuna pruriens]